jgi:dephospho-CoA kinase
VFGNRSDKSEKTNSTKPNPSETHLPSGPDINPEAERAFLEQVTHGRIGELLGKQAEDFAATGRVKAIVLDAALLLEAGWDAMCDALVFVDAPRSARLQRAMARGWTEAEFDAREGAQETLEAKRQRADFEIDNSGDLEHLRSQVERFWRTFLAANPA